MTFNKKLRKLRKTRFLDKKTLLNFYNEYKKCLWLETYFNFKSDKKIKKLNFLKKKFEYKHSRWFLDFINPKGLFPFFFIKKDFKNKENKMNLLNILSIDEYIYRRNMFSIISPENLNWEKKISNYVENLFQKTLKTLIFQKNFEEFFFLIFETFRYDSLKYFVRCKKKHINLICFFIAQKSSKLTKKFKNWINSIINPRNISNSCGKKEVRNLRIKNFPKIFIHDKRSNFIQFLKRSFYFNFKISSFFYKKLLDNLSKAGIFDSNFYWCKTIFRVFFSFFFRIFTKKIHNSLVSSFIKKKRIKKKKL